MSKKKGTLSSTKSLTNTKPKYPKNFYFSRGMDMEVWVSKDGTETTLIGVATGPEYPPTDVQGRDMVQVAWFRAKDWDHAKRIEEVLFGYDAATSSQELTSCTLDTEELAAIQEMVCSGWTRMGAVAEVVANRESATKPVKRSTRKKT
jgi:hypothetical protein